MAIHTHPNYYPVYHTINTVNIYRTSQLVSSLSGMIIQPNKAIVGRNAFLHESGIHQDGMLKNKLTYEIITPEIVGVTDISLVLGKHSGRNAFRERCKELGFVDLVEAEFQKAFEDFKALCDRKKKVNDGDILAMLSSQIASSSSSASSHFLLDTVQVVSGTHTTATATVRLSDARRGVEIIDAAIGHGGPIEAVFEAIQRIVNRRFRLLQYEVIAIGEGIDALGKVDLKITAETEGVANGNGNGTANGNGKIDKPRVGTATFAASSAHTDIILASAKAYVAAINRLLKWEEEETTNGEGKGRSLVEERRVDV